MKYTDTCLMFKILNGKAPPPLSTFIKQKTPLVRDCVISYRSSSFSQSSFSVRASLFRNTVPTDKRSCASYHTFTQTLKAWLLKIQKWIFSIYKIHTYKLYYYCCYYWLLCCQLVICPLPVAWWSPSHGLGMYRVFTRTLLTMWCDLYFFIFFSLSLFILN